MAEEKVHRRLAAIMAADVVGYSRLMGDDEVGALRALTAHRAEMIDPCIAEHEGRIFKTLGDGFLAEFPSVVDAVHCAVAIQDGMTARHDGIAEDRRIALRIGVNLGDVIVQQDDVYGDGVNIASRLEGLAEPGGICVSAMVQEQVEGKLDLAFDDLGHKTVKNIAKPLHAFAVVPSGTGPSAPAPEPAPPLHQDIRFCVAQDGVQLAYSTVGSGPPLIKTANWLNHLEFDLESPVWRHVLHAMAEDHCLIRYDQRGNGLSDIEVEDISQAAWNRDFKTVVEAAGLDRFAILGISQGCATAIDYVVHHPERVSKLVLYGGYLRGRDNRGSPTIIEQEEALISLIRSGWGQENPAFRQVFTSLFVPDATPEQMDWFNELQRRTTTPENAIRIRQTQNAINALDLAPKVTVPTLVLHARDDGIVPFEEGRRMAAMIPTASLVALDGRNHLMLENEPAWPRFLEEVRAFLREND